MSSRKRSLRSIGSRKLRRSLPPLLENLETRLVLSQSGLSAVLRPIPGPGAPPTPPVYPPGAPPSISTMVETPGYRLKMVVGAGGGLVPYVGNNPFAGGGYTPIQLQTAYEVNKIDFGGGIKGTGAGQTIAVIDAGNNPSFVPSTDPNFSTSALAVFDKTFGIPDPPVFGMYNQTGGTTLPAAVPG